MRVYSRSMGVILACSLSIVAWILHAGFADSGRAASEVAENSDELSSNAPPNLRPIGGKWYLQEGQPAIYYYQDADRYVDLFSYHTKDSNKDGIPNLRISHDDLYLIIRSQGYPNHPTALFPNSGNPNSIRVHDFTFRLPLMPKLAKQITQVPMGPIGMAINGVVFFNPFEMGGMNAVEGYSEVWLDSCCGHPEQRGVYHYHKYPSCVKSPFVDDGKRHSPIIGFAFDGFPVHGPYEDVDSKARDLKGSHALDVCNGHSDSKRGYHYHVTPGQFPYIIGGYAGIPEISNNHQMRRSPPGAIRNNSQGQSRLDNVIVGVRPGSVQRGQQHRIEFEIRPENARRDRVPPGPPTWAQIGPYEAKMISRLGNIVTVEIDVPSDASLASLLDCHLEFDLPFGRDGRIVYKRNDALRVVE